MSINEPKIKEKKLSSQAFSKSLMVVKLKFNQTFFELYKLATLFCFIKV